MFDRFSPFSLGLRRRGGEVAPVISITSGTGYAGSVLTSTRAGEWYVNNAPVGPAVSATLTVTLAQEGQPTRCDNSNVIQMWTPAALTTAQKTNGGWWGGGIQTEAGGKVTAWPDRLGVRDMTQATGANQPEAGLIGARPVAIWPSAANDRFLGPAAAFTPRWWLIVMQYRDGTPANWISTGGLTPGYFGIISSGNTTSSIFRVMAGAPDTPTLYTSEPKWTGEASMNAGIYSSTVLPMPMALMEMRGNAHTAAWAIGRGSGTEAPFERGWQGPMMLAIACGEEPTGDTLARLQGYAAHACGLAASLPSGHAYKTNAPRIS